MTHRLSFTHWLIISGILLSGILLVPMLFAATFLSKMLVMIGLGLLLGAAVAVRMISANRVSVVISPVTGALLALAVTTLASIFFTQPYPAGGLIGLGGFVVWAALAGCLLTALLQPEAEAAEEQGHLTGWSTQLQYRILISLGLVTTIVAITSVLEQFGVGPAKWFNVLLGVNLPTDLRFSITGSPLAAAELGAITVVGWLLLCWQQKRWSALALGFILTALVTLGLNTWAMLPGKVANIALPSWSTSWSLILDTLRTPRTALIGFGTDSYGTVYSRLRPIWVNGTPEWQLTFNSANNWPFTLLVTQGVLGFLAWLWLVLATGKVMRQAPHQLVPLIGILVISFLLQLVLPLQVGILAVQMLVLVSLTSSLPSVAQVIQFKPKHWWPAAVGWLVLIGLAGASWYYAGLIKAYYHLYAADRAAFKNDATQLYDQHRQAVVASPYLDLVRRQYALTNLRLALAMSTNKNPTEADKTQITQLVSQAIREAKAATIIDPTNSQNWIALAEIYRNLSTVNKDANQWTITALNSAIETDPNNPILRLDMGQILLTQNLLNESAQSFNQAINLKPDLPGGYYQLGQVFKLANQLDKTQSLWQKALTLLPANSEAYRAVNTSLKEVTDAIEATMSAKTTKKPAAAAGTSPSNSGLNSAEDASQSALLRLTKDSSQTVLDAAAPPAGGERTTDVVDNPSVETQPTVSPSP